MKKLLLLLFIMFFIFNTCGCSKKVKTNSSSATSESTIPVKEEIAKPVIEGYVSGKPFDYWLNTNFGVGNAGLTFYDFNDDRVLFSLGVDDGSEYCYQQEIDMRDCEGKWQGHYNDGIAVFEHNGLTLKLNFLENGTIKIDESGKSPYSQSLAGDYKEIPISDYYQSSAEEPTTEDKYIVQAKEAITKLYKPSAYTDREIVSISQELVMQNVYKHLYVFDVDMEYNQNGEKGKHSRCYEIVYSDDNGAGVQWTYGNETGDPFEAWYNILANYIR